LVTLFSIIHGTSRLTEDELTLLVGPIWKANESSLGVERRARDGFLAAFTRDSFSRLLRVGHHRATSRVLCKGQFLEELKGGDGRIKSFAVSGPSTYQELERVRFFRHSWIAEYCRLVDNSPAMVTATVSVWVWCLAEEE